MLKKIAAAAAAGLAAVLMTSCGSIIESKDISPETSVMADKTIPLGDIKTVDTDLSISKFVIKLGEKNEVHYRVCEEIEPVISESEGKLTVKRKDNKSYSYTGTDADNYIEVTLSKKLLDDVNIRMTAGDVCIEGIDFGGTIKNSSGSISVTGCNSERDIDLKTSSGGIGLKDSRLGKVDADSSSGSISISDCKSDKDISLTSSSGGIGLKDSKLGKVDADSSSGNISISDCKSDKDISLTSSSGEIVIKNCVLGKVNARSSSGNQYIEGVTSEMLDLDSISGNTTVELYALCDLKIESSSGEIEVKLPCSENECSLEVKTSSGEIIAGGSRYEKKYAKDNGSGCKVSCKTSSGDITVKYR